MLQKILAIDFGTQRVGLATSQASFAFPLEILPNSPAVFEELVELLRIHEIQKILIGLSEGAMAEQTKVFAKKLQEYTTLPIEFADETLSSHAVHTKLKNAKLTKPGQRIDHYAAAEFLQEWLDSQPQDETV